MALPHASDLDVPPPATARRSILAGSGLAVAASLVPAAADAADRGAAHHHGARLLPVQARHLVGRFSYGVTPALAHEVEQHGGARSWFEWQLSPHHVTDHEGRALASWFPHLRWSPTKVAAENDSGKVGGWEVMTDYQNWLLLRRMRSRQQVLEVMTEFWENHFNVPVSADGVYTWRVRYGQTIRARALDSFESLLQAVSVHPAMGMYLGNAVSTKDHPNENQGRELLELHTVGLGAGYHERDVVDSARILTGWQVAMWTKHWDAGYEELAHYRGKVRVLGFHSPNHSANGKHVTRHYLHYLAHHPSTAQHIATKLATAFVSDHPPRALVNHLAHVYLAHGTQIKPVLRALVDSPQFKHSVGQVIRDPENDLVATYRLMGVHVAKPHAADRTAHELVWQASAMGQEPMAWPAPNGRPIVGAAWSSPSRVMGSMATHYSMANGWWPVKGVHYPKPEAWLPGKSVRFDHLVDHMSQRILHRHADARLHEACRQAVAVRGHEQITKEHPLMQWMFGRLLTTFFDSPDFFRR
ncbi:MAG TPA: DUF1800 domain-containing protein [Nocardioides sp.]|jgi:hypothetical protein|nr:DUF1800 domain-containing protein [Nocardioides sp.]